MIVLCECILRNPHFQRCLNRIMSEIRVNVRPPAETAQTRAPNRPKRRFRKKRCQSEQNGNMEGKYENHHRGRKFRRNKGPRQNHVPAGGLLFSNPPNNLFVHLSGTTRAAEYSREPSASTPSSSFLPSLNNTASASEHGHKPSTSTQNKNFAPTQRLSHKPSTSAQTQGFPHPSRVARAPPCSHKPSASTHSRQGKPKEPWSAKPASASASAATPTSSVTSSHKPPSTKPAASVSGLPTKYLAIDCEMVGTGPKGSISQLARCSVVNYEGDVVYDKFINPSMPVTDYRTRWSGIRRSDLMNATPYAVARKEILKLLMGKVVIGHAIHNDFKVLGYSHPGAMTRDTSRIPLLNQRAGFPENQCASLKRLTKAVFNRDIQTGKKGHSSVEDAKATMELYKVIEEEWERTLASGSQPAWSQV